VELLLLRHNIHQLKSLIQLMDSSEKYKLSGLLFISLTNALMQTMGLISIMPFIALISEPSLADSQRHIILIKDAFGIQSYKDLLIFFGVLSFISLLISNALVIINYWINLWFFNNFGLKTSTTLLSNYLQNPPHSFYKNSTSKLSKRIFSDVDRVVVGTLLAYIGIFTDIVILLVITGLLIFVNPLATVVIITILISCYMLIYMLIAKKIDVLGRSFNIDEDSIFSIIKQSLEFYKEIRISGKQDFFIKKYYSSAKRLYRGTTKFYALKFIPIQIIELSIFLIILCLAGYLAISSNNIGITITTISIYAFSAYRIVPVLKGIFDNVEEILHTRSIFQPLINEINGSGLSSDIINKNIVTLTNSISLKHINFTYLGNKSPVIKDLSLSFNKGELTCIIGKSGVGKSTLLDILLGIIRPDSGTIYADNIEITSSNLVSWQKNIGYVPQKIHLLESSVLENIAFGIPIKDIDIERAMVAAEIACIDELINGQLEGGYSTQIGDGGHLLSGGEVQRIGLARAVYGQPKILILDEATNALDSDTESMIISNLKALDDMTIIFVTHKTSVINLADELINLSNLDHKKLK
jgi:ABC-type bacteriocin/lantibiotic exporter with double-glycine peptidase domain